jgi:hypothetical protein
MIVIGLMSPLKVIGLKRLRLLFKGVVSVNNWQVPPPEVGCALVGPHSEPQLQPLNRLA